jgi:hypothetical protein
VLGFRITERSWWEMAPERRWACPRRRPDGGITARVPSPFVGLVLIRPGPVVVPSPPMNSLPPRLWADRPDAPPPRVGEECTESGLLPGLVGLGGSKAQGEAGFSTEMFAGRWRLPGCTGADNRLPSFWLR